MIAIERKKLEQVLEALEACIDYIAPHSVQGEKDADLADKAIKTIEEALAQPAQGCNCDQGQCCHICDPDIANGWEQPAQEPVAWISPKGHIHFDPYLDSIPLYTTPQPRPWVGLTEKEIDEWTPEIHGVIRLIEAQLKEKNFD